MKFPVGHSDVILQSVRNHVVVLPSEALSTTIESNIYSESNLGFSKKPSGSETPTRCNSCEKGIVLYTPQFYCRQPIRHSRIISSANLRQDRLPASNLSRYHPIFLTESITVRETRCDSEIMLASDYSAHAGRVLPVRFDRVDREYWSGFHLEVL